jgi:release factor glutamine methyltransferase
MQISEFIKKSTQSLTLAGIATARLDTLVMLEHVTHRDKAWILAHPENDVKTKDYATLSKLLNRRLRHEPLAYILQRSEFYAREYIISPSVLEPRPESEAIIDLLKEIARGPDLSSSIHVSDVGTGSGALGITAALEVPTAKVELLEIDPKAIKVAQKNVDKFTLGIKVINSNLLKNSSQKSDVLLCNLPYVPDDYPINEAASFEPKIAIFGGPDGLDIYRQLFTQIDFLDYLPLYILTESLPTQHQVLESLALSSGYTLTKTTDFVQQFKNSA